MRTPGEVTAVADVADTRGGGPLVFVVARTIRRVRTRARTHGVLMPGAAPKDARGYAAREPRGHARSPRSRRRGVPMSKRHRQTRRGEKAAAVRLLDPARDVPDLLEHLR